MGMGRLPIWTVRVRVRGLLARASTVRRHRRDGSHRRPDADRGMRRLGRVLRARRVPDGARNGALESPTETATGTREETPPISVGGPGWKYINRAIPSYRLACGLGTARRSAPRWTAFIASRRRAARPRPSAGLERPFRTR